MHLVDVRISFNDPKVGKNISLSRCHQKNLLEIGLVDGSLTVAVVLMEDAVLLQTLIKQ